MKVNLFYYSYYTCKWSARLNYGQVQCFFYAPVVFALVFQAFIVEACQLSFIIHLHTGPTQG